MTFNQLLLDSNFQRNHSLGLRDLFDIGTDAYNAVHRECFIECEIRNWRGSCELSLGDQTQDREDAPGAAGIRGGVTFLNVLQFGERLRPEDLAVYQNVLKSKEYSEAGRPQSSL